MCGPLRILMHLLMQLKKSVSNNLFRGEKGGVATIGIGTSSYVTGQNFGKVGAAKRTIFQS